MLRGFYRRLAWMNIKKNGKVYIPYIITCIASVMMFYIMFALSMNKGIISLPGGRSLSTLLALGTVVIGIFATIFLFYTNSFLVKRRKKEIGVFNILGMEKKHIGKMMFFETTYVALISLSAGLVGGILLNKLMFLLLFRILKFEVKMGFEISKSGLLITVILFCIIFMLTLLSTLSQIHLVQPIELLKGEETGEKEPKTKWILAVMGFVTLGAGYYLAVTAVNPMEAIFSFFIAVVLVIVGTYCLFIAGSIAVLKLLRKNKKYYYKANHFISVSGMIYRMKQNAVGLANICILSTMVLVMLSGTLSLYIGIENTLKQRFPQDITFRAFFTSEKSEEESSVDEKIKKVLKEKKIKTKNSFSFSYLLLDVEEQGNQFVTIPKVDAEGDKSVRKLCIITLEEYNRLEKSKKSLEKNEALFYSKKDSYEPTQFDLHGETFQVKEKMDSFEGEKIAGVEQAVFELYYIVVKDSITLNQIIDTQNKKEKNEVIGTNYYYGVNPEVSEAEGERLGPEIRKESPGIMVDTIYETRRGVYMIYGGLFFLGIFLGSFFMMATILIMYYKQISEGNSDKQRFTIMKKVGLKKREIKKTIRSQVLTVFFLPLIMAVIHIVFAFPVITRLLALLGLTDNRLIMGCTIGTIMVFGICYGIVYAITARVYYKIVE